MIRLLFLVLLTTSVGSARAGASASPVGDCSTGENARSVVGVYPTDPLVLNCEIARLRIRRNASEVGVSQWDLLVELAFAVQSGRSADVIRLGERWLAGEVAPASANAAQVTFAVARAYWRLGRLETARALLKPLRDEATEDYAPVDAMSYAIVAHLSPTVATGEAKPMPARRNDAGFIAVDGRIGEREASFEIDTGAEISAISASLAAALGVVPVADVPAFTVLKGASDAGGYDEVSARLATASKLELGGVTVENVAFAVLDDAELISPEYVVLGTPVLRTLGGVTWRDRGREILLGEPMQAAGCARARGDLYWADDLLKAAVDVRGERVPILLDTGAANSEAYASGLAHYAPKLKKEYSLRTPRIGRIRRVAVGFGGERVIIRNMTVWRGGPSLGGPYNAFLLGEEIVRKFDYFALDLRSMTYVADKRVAAACRRP
ncbi:MAG: retropepsin-like aspartic protease [Pseudomonadota bacterium]